MRGIAKVVNIAGWVLGAYWFGPWFLVPGMLVALSVSVSEVK